VATVAQQNLAGRFKRRSLSDAMAGISKLGALSRQHPIAPIDGQDLHVFSCKHRAARLLPLCN
jgi:hypothetical protein